MVKETLKMILKSLPLMYLLLLERGGKKASCYISSKETINEIVFAGSGCFIFVNKMCACVVCNFKVSSACIKQPGRTVSIRIVFIRG